MDPGQERASWAGLHPGARCGCVAAGVLSAQSRTGLPAAAGGAGQDTRGGADGGSPVCFCSLLCCQDQTAFERGGSCLLVLLKSFRAGKFVFAAKIKRLSSG